MGFVIQKLLPSLKPGQRLGLTGSDTTLHSRQGAWDGSCALHCAAMALATLGLLNSPSQLACYADGPEAEFWNLAWPYYMHGITISELTGLLAELRWNLRTITAEGSHETVTRFCERELALGWPVIVSWRQQDVPLYHAALAVGLEGKTCGHRFEPDTMLLLDPDEAELRLMTHNARLACRPLDLPDQAHYVTAYNRRTVVLDSALAIRPGTRKT
ncbi:hypothetical protein [Paraburkholderia caballeronis]|uniref:hypothetical protein n=1 Tax=Paraburkholderia caballeronis TaxID=416943 RepID=UPI0010DAFB00|nr:hypothetical protein [Paraburkholderia caballeronis]TDV16307.1 hypothetical protein C7406_108168 [Paraburkholderia caballeronis]TDV20657.1 hypothetical protein C7408_101168 [Paraburkholderia caballeronis]TDV33125.1 hypothetical protein C7404_101264 [Paraburkholderia caballeronis]